MTTNLDIALRAARQFGAESVVNDDFPGWSKDDRENIAYYYGVENWFDIPEKYKELLFKAYRGGEQLEKKLIRDNWDWRKAYENSLKEND